MIRSVTTQDELPVRLAAADEQGIEFIEWLAQRTGGNSAMRQRLAAFIEEWDHLRDDVRQRDVREPTLEEYSARWGVALSSAYRRLSEFREVVGIAYPGPLCDLLWDGMPRFTGRGGPPRPKWLLAVEIVAQ